MYEQTLNRSKAVPLLGVILALGLGSFPITRVGHEFANTAHLVANEIYWWSAVGLVLIFVTRIERRPLNSIGLRRPTLWGWFSAIGAGILMLAGLAGLLYLVFPALHLSINNSVVNQFLGTPRWWLWISTVRAAVAEEVLFRGYPMERLEEISGSRTLAAILSCGIFSLAHVSVWGWAHLILAGFGGICLTVLYLWRRNLWVNIIAHFIVDATALLSA